MNIDPVGGVIFAMIIAAVLFRLLVALCDMHIRHRRRNSIAGRRFLVVCDRAERILGEKK